MTDEGAKVLAAAIEKLADAISKAQPGQIIVYPVQPITAPAPQFPQYPWQSPFFTTCGGNSAT